MNYSTILLVLFFCSWAVGLVPERIDLTNRIWFCVNSMQGSLKNLNDPVFVKKGDWFNIQTRLGRPNDAYVWQEADEWNVINYCIPAFKLIKEEVSVPASYGGDLLKLWLFEAREKGAFEISFARGVQSVIIKVVVE